jgi:diaminohydroxyphosphoribosylaminopyrimidine deaminase / 5-amino-6-(5-phosphoribosylamino)uracil reductase
LSPSVAPETYWPTLLATRALPAAASADPLALAYLDFATPDRVVLAHLGQSLDGRIATASGHSAGVTGPENIAHLHRLRALADAVLVGAGTVRHDDPQLTTRLVEGPSPIRVVIDSRRRLEAGFGLFQAGPPTLVCCAEAAFDRGQLGLAEVVPVAADEGGCRPAAVLDALRARGLNRIFIEGGGQTVSRFLYAGCLDILEICVSPVIIGAGRSAISGPVITRMDEALRLDGPAMRMGGDMLYHFRLERRSAAG